MRARPTKKRITKLNSCSVRLPSHCSFYRSPGCSQAFVRSATRRFVSIAAARPTLLSLFTFCQRLLLLRDFFLCRLCICHWPVPHYIRLVIVTISTELVASLNARRTRSNSGSGSSSSSKKWLKKNSSPTEITANRGENGKNLVQRVNKVA